MLGIEKKAARYTWTAALVALLMCCVYLVRETLIIFAVALLLTYLLYPLFVILTRILPGRSRAPALVLVYMTLFGLLTLLLITVGSQVASEANSLAGSVQGLMANLKQQADKAPEPQSAKSFQDTILDAARDQIAEHTGELLS